MSKRSRTPPRDPRDFLTPEEHRDQDKQVLRAEEGSVTILKEDENPKKFVVLSLMAVTQTVAAIANSGGTNFMKTLAPMDFRTLLTDDGIFTIMMEAVRKEEFAPIRMIRELQADNIDELVRKKFLPEDSPETKKRLVAGQIATQLAWNETYIGDAWKLIEQKVADIYAQRDGPYYAPFFNFVQSSGTGKSRMIDEYSKHHIVIPICLRAEGQTGYPYADAAAREYLCVRGMDTDRSLKKTHAFLFALFDLAGERLRDLAAQKRTAPDQSLEMPVLAEAFRSLMSDRSIRDEFYNLVVANAREIENTFKIEPEQATPTKQLKLGETQVTLDGKAKEFGTLLKSLTTPSKDEILVLISFDEAHTLAPKKQEGWTPFESVRHALRKLRKQPILSVFLSTTGKVYAVVSRGKADSSARMRFGELRDHDPLCATGYDEMTRRYVIEGMRRVEDFAKIGNMIRFGRPLFYTTYTNGDDDVKDDILNFACQKLLNGRTDSFLPPGGTTEEHKPGDIIAILATRLPLEFNTLTLAGRREALDQVHKHSRICLHIHDQFQSCQSVQPAEPILATAAFRIVQYRNLDQAQELLKVLEGPSIDKGNRGELIAMLLVLLARDAAVIKYQVQTAPVIKLTDLIEHLFNERWVDAVLDAKPTVLRQTQDEPTSANAREMHERLGDEDVPLRDMFKDARVYITQFIKVHDATVLSREFLWMAVARGAAIACHTNAVALDLAVPFVFWDAALGRWNVSAIIFQVKNDEKFKATTRSYLFKAMNPYAIGLFSEDEEEPPLPIIRVVFALASRESTVHVVPNTKTLRRNPSREAKDPNKSLADTGNKVKKPVKRSFTSYDIWCARASKETFKVIEDDSVYEKLLHLTKDFPGAYNAAPLSDEAARRRSMHPMALSDPAHWGFGSPSSSALATYFGDNDSNMMQF